MKSVTVHTLGRMKQTGQKITCLTAYDYSFASLIDEAGVDIILVGDSLGMVMQGHQNTVPVTMEHMIYHTQCVARGCRRALLIADLPFGSFQRSPGQALDNAVRLMSEGGAHMVKLEGGEPMAETVRFLVERGIPVCAHIGLTPQSVHQFGGFRVQGRDEQSARRLRHDAELLQQAGAGVIVLESIPYALAAQITSGLQIPTIGIGAGIDCDGQVLVLHDVLGIYPRPSPKFARNFMAGAGDPRAALKSFVDAVRAGTFPGPEHSFGDQ